MDSINKEIRNKGFGTKTKKEPETMIYDSEKKFQEYFENLENQQIAELTNREKWIRIVKIILHYNAKGLFNETALKMILWSLINNENPFQKSALTEIMQNKAKKQNYTLKSEVFKIDIEDMRYKNPNALKKVLSDFRCEGIISSSERAVFNALCKLDKIHAWILYKALYIFIDKFLWG